MDARLLEEAIRYVQSKTSDITVGELWERFDLANRRAKKSWSTYETRWKVLGPFWRDKKVSSISESDVEQYRKLRESSRGRDGGNTKPTTRNLEIAILNSCISWGVGKGHVHSNPIVGIEREIPNDERNVWFTDTQIDKLIETAQTVSHPLLACFIEMDLFSGMRKDELRLLKRSELQEGFIVLGGGRRTKNSYGRRIPMWDRFKSAMESLPKSRSEYVITNPRNFRDPLPDSTLYSWWTETLKAAGMMEVNGQRPSIHSMRHTCAKRLVDKGTPWPVVKYIMGWRSESAAKRYVHVDAETLRQVTI